MGLWLSSRGGRRFVLLSGEDIVRFAGSWPHSVSFLLSVCCYVPWASAWDRRILSYPLCFFFPSYLPFNGQALSWPGSSFGFERRKGGDVACLRGHRGIPRILIQGH